MFTWRLFFALCISIGSSNCKKFASQMCEAQRSVRWSGENRTMAWQRRKGHVMSAYASHALHKSGSAICLVSDHGADPSGHRICVRMPCRHRSATDCSLILLFITLKFQESTSSNSELCTSSILHCAPHSLHFTLPCAPELTWLRRRRVTQKWALRAAL